MKQYSILNVLGILVAVGILVMCCSVMFLPRFQGVRIGAMSSESANKLKRIGIGLNLYHGEHDTLPPGATVDSKQVVYHSWMTHLLPYMESEDLYQQIKMNAPWNDPSNAKPFGIKISGFLSPFVDEIQSADGYALSHYSANNKLISEKSQVNMVKDVPDGASNTIMCGEIKDNLPAWGDPANRRDPALGLNTSPDGFGNPERSGAYLLFGDGRVKFIFEDIDPKLLKSLSTPAGGEVISKMF